MTLVALPSWQVLLNAVDPVGVLWPVADLPTELPPTPEGLPIEQVLLIVDRGLPEWERDRYLLIAPRASDPVQLAWFPEPPTAPILGQLLLVLRPPQVLDESINKELWFFEE